MEQYAHDLSDNVHKPLAPSRIGQPRAPSSVPDSQPRRRLISDTPTFYLTRARTPIYDAIREQTGIDPVVIFERPHWSFLAAYMRLFGKTPDPADTVGKITANADGSHATNAKGRHAADTDGRHARPR